MIPTSPLPELRPDLQAVATMIPRGASVLDLGCGDGALLEYLKRHKEVRGRGIEQSEAGVLACVRRGLSVRQGNLQEGLADYPTGSFDCVILSQTLQFLDDPPVALREMLRVGQSAVVSFPNWGHWRCRLELLARGRMPQAPDFPQPWYDTPRRQSLTVIDFLGLCHREGFDIREAVYLSGKHTVHQLVNLRARTAVLALRSSSIQAG